MDAKRKDDSINGREDPSRVKVHLRLKPSILSERINYNISSDGNQLHIPNIDGRSDRDKWYGFDNIYATTTTNTKIYKSAAYDVVESALTGINTSIFAYGQTGSGKTYSLMSEDGVTAHMISHLFDRIAKDPTQEYSVSCSFLQIYNEHIYDLLNPRNSLECTVREDSQLGTYVENITHVLCESPDHVYELINIGRNSLIIAETKMNHQSSRSHAVCQLSIEQKKEVPRLESKKSSHSSKMSILAKDSAFSEGRSSTPNIEEFDVDGDERERPKSNSHIDFNTIPFKRDLLKRRHSIAATKVKNGAKCADSIFLTSSTPTITVRENTSFTDQSDSTYYNSENKIGEDNQADFDNMPCFLHENSTMRSSSACYVERRDESNSMLYSRDNVFDDSYSDYTENGERSKSSMGDEHDSVFVNEITAGRKNFESTETRIIKSKISIIDLAGSERVKKSHSFGERLKEAQHINLSLLELGNVISALASGTRKHVPYRNSILTRLLQDSLGGNCKTVFLLCISTRMSDIIETKCTLEFGQKLKKVVTKPKRNIGVDYKTKYDNLLIHIEELERQHDIELQKCSQRLLHFEQEQQETMAKSSDEQAKLNNLLIEFNNINSQHMEAQMQIEKLEKEIKDKEDILQLLGEKLTERKFRVFANVLETSGINTSIDIKELANCKCECTCDRLNLCDVSVTTNFEQVNGELKAHEKQISDSDVNVDTKQEVKALHADLQENMECKKKKVFVDASTNTLPEDISDLLSTHMVIHYSSHNMSIVRNEMDEQYDDDGLLLERRDSSNDNAIRNDPTQNNDNRHVIDVNDDGLLTNSTAKSREIMVTDETTVTLREYLQDFNTVNKQESLAFQSPDNPSDVCLTVRLSEANSNSTTLKTNIEADDIEETHDIKTEDNSHNHENKESPLDADVYSPHDENIEENKDNEHYSDESFNDRIDVQVENNQNQNVEMATDDTQDFTSECLSDDSSDFPDEFIAIYNVNTSEDNLANDPDMAEYELYENEDASVVFEYDKARRERYNTYSRYDESNNLPEKGDDDKFEASREYGSLNNSPRDDSYLGDYTTMSEIALSTPLTELETDDLKPSPDNVNVESVTSSVEIISPHRCSTQNTDMQMNENGIDESLSSSPSPRDHSPYVELTSNSPSSTHGMDGSIELDVINSTSAAIITTEYIGDNSDDSTIGSDDVVIVSSPRENLDDYSTISDDVDEEISSMDECEVTTVITTTEFVCDESKRYSHDFTLLQENNSSEETLDSAIELQQSGELSSGNTCISISRTVVPLIVASRESLVTPPYDVANDINFHRDAIDPEYLSPSICPTTENMEVENSCFTFEAATDDVLIERVVQTSITTEITTTECVLQVDADTLSEENILHTRSLSETDETCHNSTKADDTNELPSFETEHEESVVNDICDDAVCRKDSDNESRATEYTVHDHNHSDTEEQSKMPDTEVSVEGEVVLLDSEDMKKLPKETLYVEPLPEVCSPTSVESETNIEISVDIVNETDTMQGKSTSGNESPAEGKLILADKDDTEKLHGENLHIQPTACIVTPVDTEFGREISVDTLNETHVLCGKTTPDTDSYVKGEVVSPDTDGTEILHSEKFHIKSLHEARISPTVKTETDRQLLVDVMNETDVTHREPTSVIESSVEREMIPADIDDTHVESSPEAFISSSAELKTDRGISVNISNELDVTHREPTPEIEPFVTRETIPVDVDDTEKLHRGKLHVESLPEASILTSVETETGREISVNILSKTDVMHEEQLTEIENAEVELISADMDDLAKIHKEELHVESLPEVCISTLVDTEIGQDISVDTLNETIVTYGKPIPDADSYVKEEMVSSETDDMELQHSEVMDIESSPDACISTSFERENDRQMSVDVLSTADVTHRESPPEIESVGRELVAAHIDDTEKLHKGKVHIALSLTTTDNPEDLGKEMVEIDEIKVLKSDDEENVIGSKVMAAVITTTECIGSELHVYPEDKAVELKWESSTNAYGEVTISTSEAIFEESVDGNITGKGAVPYSSRDEQMVDAHVDVLERLIASKINDGKPGSLNETVSKEHDDVYYNDYNSDASEHIECTEEDKSNIVDNSGDDMNIEHVMEVHVIEPVDEHTKESINMTSFANVPLEQDTKRSENEVDTDSVYVREGIELLIVDTDHPSHHHDAKINVCKEDQNNEDHIDNNDTPTKERDSFESQISCNDSVCNISASQMSNDQSDVTDESDECGVDMPKEQMIYNDVISELQNKLSRIPDFINMETESNIVEEIPDEELANENNISHLSIPLSVGSSNSNTSLQNKSLDDQEHHSANTTNTVGLIKQSSVVLYVEEDGCIPPRDIACVSIDTSGDERNNFTEKEDLVNSSPTIDKIDSSLTDECERSVITPSNKRVDDIFPDAKLGNEITRECYDTQSDEKSVDESCGESQAKSVDESCGESQTKSVDESCSESRATSSLDDTDKSTHYYSACGGDNTLSLLSEKSNEKAIFDESHEENNTVRNHSEVLSNNSAAHSLEGSNDIAEDEAADNENDICFVFQYMTQEEECENHIIDSDSKEIEDRGHVSPVKTDDEPPEVFVRITEGSTDSLDVNVDSDTSIQSLSTCNDISSDELKRASPFNMDFGKTNSLKVNLTNNKHNNIGPVSSVKCPVSECALDDHNFDDDSSTATSTNLNESCDKTIAESTDLSSPRSFTDGWIDSTEDIFEGRKHCETKTFLSRNHPCDHVTSSLDEITSAHKIELLDTNDFDNLACRIGDLLNRKDLSRPRSNTWPSNDSSDRHDDVSLNDMNSRDDEKTTGASSILVSRSSDSIHVYQLKGVSNEKANKPIPISGNRSDTDSITTGFDKLALHISNLLNARDLEVESSSVNTDLQDDLNNISSPSIKSKPTTDPVYSITRPESVGEDPRNSLNTRGTSNFKHMPASHTNAHATSKKCPPDEPIIPVDINIAYVTINSSQENLTFQADVLANEIVDKVHGSDNTVVILTDRNERNPDANVVLDSANLSCYVVDYSDIDIKFGVINQSGDNINEVMEIQPAHTPKRSVIDDLSILSDNEENGEKHRIKNAATTFIDKENEDEENYSSEIEPIYSQVNIDREKNRNDNMISNDINNANRHLPVIPIKVSDDQGYNNSVKAPSIKSNDSCDSDTVTISSITTVTSVMESTAIAYDVPDNVSKDDRSSSKQDDETYPYDNRHSFPKGDKTIMDPGRPLYSGTPIVVTFLKSPKKTSYNIEATTSIRRPVVEKSDVAIQTPILRRITDIVTQKNPQLARDDQRLEELISNTPSSIADIGLFVQAENIDRIRCTILVELLALQNLCSRRKAVVPDDHHTIDRTLDVGNESVQVLGDEKVEITVQVHAIISEIFQYIQNVLNKTTATLGMTSHNDEKVIIEHNNTPVIENILKDTNRKFTKKDMEAEIPIEHKYSFLQDYLQSSKQSIDKELLKTAHDITNNTDLQIDINSISEHDMLERVIQTLSHRNLLSFNNLEKIHKMLKIVRSDYAITACLQALARNEKSSTHAHDDSVPNVSYELAIRTVDPDEQTEKERHHTFNKKSKDSKNGRNLFSKFLRMPSKSKKLKEQSKPEFQPKKKLKRDI